MKTLTIIKYAFTLFGLVFMILALNGYTQTGDLIWASIFGGIGCVFFFIGLGIILSEKIKGNAIKRLKEIGLPIETQFHKVEVNENVNVNGRNPLRIISHWTNNNELHVFRSENIYTDIPEITVKDKITVLVDPDNKKKYYMDIGFLKQSGIKKSQIASQVADSTSDSQIKEQGQQSMVIRMEDTGARYAVKKEQGEQRMMINLKDSSGIRSSMIVGFAAIGFVELCVITGGGSPLVGIAILVIGVLIVLGIHDPFGTRITIDKPTDTITFRRRPFLLFASRRIIPISNVMNVDIDQPKLVWRPSGRHGTSGSFPYRLFCLIANKKVKIAKSDDYWKIRHLAEEIGDFIGKPFQQKLVE